VLVKAETLLSGGNILNKGIILFAAIFVSAIVIVSCFKTAFAETSVERASIEAADSSIDKAFANVLAAEKAGGDVTQLLARLNAAGELLADADNAYQSGNLANVTSEAESAQTLANQVSSEAINLIGASIDESQNSLVLTLFFSATGAAIFVVALLLFWRRFKREHLKRLLFLKPEAVRNAA
jgi:hypothetical protein